MPAAFPTAVATNLNTLVAIDQKQTSLIAPMLIGDTSAAVASTSGWSIAAVCTVESEQMLVTGIIGSNILNVLRAFGGTAAAAHAQGKAVEVFVDAVYHNNAAAEILAVEAALGANMKFVAPGVVRMTHDDAGDWTVVKPDGSALNIAGTATQGLQEAIIYAWSNALPLVVYGGGITPPSGTPPSTALSQIMCTTTVAFPTGWNNSADFYAINLMLFTGNNDGITFDSCDLTRVDFHNSQIIYPGNGNVIHFNPLHDNGESFAGFTESIFHLGHIVPVVATNNLAPDPTKGTGILITVPNLALGLADGNGVCAAVLFDIREINGGLVGFKVSNPVTGSGGFQGNWITFGDIHQQGGSSIQLGTSALTNTGQDTTWGNRFWGKLAPTNTGGIAINTWGGADFNGAFQYAGDEFYVAISNGTTGIQFNSSATCNKVHSAMISCATDLANNATAQTNHLDISRPIRAVNIAVGASPFVYQNKDCVPEMVLSATGTVSALETSVDGASWIPTGVAAGPFNLLVGQYLRWTYSVAPQVNKIL